MNSKVGNMLVYAIMGMVITLEADMGMVRSMVLTILVSVNYLRSFIYELLTHSSLSTSLSVPGCHVTLRQMIHT